MNLSLFKRDARRVAAAVGMWVVVQLSVVGLIILFAQTRLDHMLRDSQQTMLQSVEKYERALQNARFPARRFELLLQKSRDASSSRFKVVEDQMLQLSLGFDYEYFMLRSLKGETRVEVRRGGLVAKKSRFAILGEERFFTLSAGIHLRPCSIANHQYLCVIDIRNPAEHIEDRSYSIIVLSRESFVLQARREHFPSSFVTSDPLLRMSLNDKIYPLSGDDRESSILQKSIKIDEGITLSGGFSLYPFLFRVFLVSTFVCLVILEIVVAVQGYTKRRIRTKSDAMLLRSKLEHYNNIQTLIRGVVHDIKSSLSVLSSLARYEDDQNKRTMIDHVTKRMQMIIRDLEFKGKSAQASKFSLLPIDMLIQLILLEKSREHLAMRFTYNSPSSPCWTRGSHSDVLRMMSNILNNAVEASEAGSTIGVECNVDNNGTINVFVKDQGRGIPDDYLPLIFEKGESRGKVNGSGFGLYHAKRVVQSMNGTISIVSKVGVGTELRMSWPCQHPPLWAMDELSLESVDTVLVIDDEAIYHRIWKEKMTPYDVEMLAFAHPSLVPTSHMRSSGSLVILDNNFNADYGLGFRFLESQRIPNCVIMTAEWSVPEVQREAERLHVKLLGKDFLDQLRIVR